MDINVLHLNTHLDPFMYNQRIGLKSKVLLVD